MNFKVKFIRTKDTKNSGKNPPTVGHHHRCLPIFDSHKGTVKDWYRKKYMYQ